MACTFTWLCRLLPHLQPWTHVLPSVSPMLIHRVAADQLRRVCSPWLADQAEDYLAAQQQGLEAHADELAGLGLSRADFEWAYGIAHSRAGGWNESAARYDIIFPGGDLVNHEQNCSAQTRCELCSSAVASQVLNGPAYSASLRLQLTQSGWHLLAGHTQRQAQMH